MNQKLKIKDQEIKVRVVFTPEKIKKGMMNQIFDDFDGMYFVLGEGNQSFWMRNCIIPMDVIFINNGIVDTIHKSCAPCYTNDCISYKGYGNACLEVPAGFCDKISLEEGDEIKLLHF